MSNDVSKLPKWAQDRIRILESEVDEWRKKALAPSTDSIIVLPGAPRLELLAQDSRRGFEAIPLVSNRVCFTIEENDLDVSPAWSDSRCKGPPDSLSILSPRSARHRATCLQRDLDSSQAMTTQLIREFSRFVRQVAP